MTGPEPIPGKDQSPTPWSHRCRDLMAFEPFQVPALGQYSSLLVRRGYQREFLQTMPVRHDGDVGTRTTYVPWLDAR
jgi:hypothetical protein